LFGRGRTTTGTKMNSPAILRMMGNVGNKRVLDLACGEGYNSRILAGKGAEVVGVDFSRELIGLAERAERSEKLGVSYCVSDASDLGFRSGCFDAVMCAMALFDIERYEDAVSEVARVLKKDGRFVFSIIHPCFEYGDLVNGKPVAEWKCEEGKALHLEISRYFGTQRLEVVWDMKRLVKPFRTTSFHRTLTDYFRELRNSGFVVTGLVEPRATLDAAAKYPSLERHRRIPHSVIIEARKTSNTLARKHVRHE
jgi:ubiquinone/menaquinone biosynthesis C-methylase UbiE